MVREEGVVTGVEGLNAVVEIERHAACGTCSACNRADVTKMEIVTENRARAKKGDRVLIEVEMPDFLMAVFLVYLFPAAGLIIGTMTGFAAAPVFGITEGRELFAGLCGILIMILIYIAASIYSRNKREGYRASIVSVIR